MNTPYVPRSDSSSFEKATMAEIHAVTGIETLTALYPYDHCIEHCDTVTDALLHGYYHGIKAVLAALRNLQKHHPTPDSLEPGFVAELLEEGLNRGLTHHGITITEQKEEGEEGE